MIPNWILGKVEQSLVRRLTGLEYARAVSVVEAFRAGAYKLPAIICGASAAEQFKPAKGAWRVQAVVEIIDDAGAISAGEHQQLAAMALDALNCASLAADLSVANLNLTVSFATVGRIESGLDTDQAKPRWRSAISILVDAVNY
jgi:hypothetical protein